MIMDLGCKKRGKSAKKEGNGLFRDRLRERVLFFLSQPVQKGNLFQSKKKGEGDLLLASIQSIRANLHNGAIFFTLFLLFMRTMEDNRAVDDF